MFTKSVWFILFTAAATIGCPFSLATELTTNGGFETGDFTGWTQFPTGVGQQTVTTVNPASGTFAGEINNSTITSNSLIKQANIGVGIVTPGQAIMISFDARGSLGVGGVAFAEFFSEISGGGVSKAQILGGGPLALNVNPNVWTHFAFSTTAGTNVSGGVTLQLGATNGAVSGSTAHLWYDNASVSVASTGPNGDYDNDGDVDGRDFLIWQRGGSPNGSSPGDLAAWQNNYGSPPPLVTILAVPEPSTWLLLSLTVAVGKLARRRRVSELIDA